MIQVRKAKSSQQGFSLIECLIAMVVTTVGLLAAAQLIVVGVRLQTESRDATAATALARSKIEELQNYAPLATQRVRGGSLTSNVVGYNDTPDPRFQRRWLVEISPTDAGVPSGTQRITVVIIPNEGGLRLPPVQLAVLASTL
jgi:prepilin-type N-terminal cleavage/methylation domain-containing protein